jgi:hypothetical protein
MTGRPVRRSEPISCFTLGRPHSSRRPAADQQIRGHQSRWQRLVEKAAGAPQEGRRAAGVGSGAWWPVAIGPAVGPHACILAAAAPAAGRHLAISRACGSSSSMADHGMEFVEADSWVWFRCALCPRWHKFTTESRGREWCSSWAPVHI